VNTSIIPLRRIFKLFCTLAIGLGFTAQASAAEYTQKNISYDFDDISPAGTGTVLIEGCDDCGRAVDLGFEFTYYGRVYTQLYVSSNGFVIPGGSAPNEVNRMGCCNGLKIPNDDNKVGVIALWWADLSLKEESQSNTTEEAGQIFYKKTGTAEDYVFIIQFNKVRHFHNLTSENSNTFQLKVFQKDNHLEMHYKQLVANENIHTIGIESPRQDEGVKYFRTSGASTLPAVGSSDFAISFKPPESVKLTSSLRYGAEDNFLQHVFTVDQAVNAIGDFVFTDFKESDSVVENIAFDNATLLNNNPAQFSLDYKLFDSLSTETGGQISGDYVDFDIVGSEFFTFDSQTVFISQIKEFDNDEDKITGQVFNNNGTKFAFKSKANLLNESTKSLNAADVFFVGRDPGTLAAEVYQLTSLTGNEKCGPPFIDDQDDFTFLYVMCETGDVSNEVSVLRYDLDSYLDDNQDAKSITVSGTPHTFNGDIETQAIVVAGQGDVAYIRDNGSGVQDIYLNGVAINIPSGSGSVSSLAIDNTGTKIVYVLDDILYLYNGSENKLTNNSVGTAHISADGSTIVFTSTENLDVSMVNTSLLQVFTIPTSSLSAFEQRTKLSSGECKLPVLSEKAKRIAVVCNQDLLNLDNYFTNREGVFIIENVTGSDITHLLTGASDVSENITSLAMSSDGSNLSFEDGDEENTFRLVGLSKLDSELEELTAKSYPVPFKLPGDGKSGSLIYLSLFLLSISLFNLYRRRI
jgi:hypothetical protein